jgi:hypothetical protein
MDLTFREPVVARVSDTRGKPALLEIRDVRDGLAALNRYGLGSNRCGTTEWHQAASHLVKAALHPCSDHVEDARRALLALAREHCSAEAVGTAQCQDTETRVDPK